MLVDMRNVPYNISHKQGEKGRKKLPRMCMLKFHVVFEIKTVIYFKAVYESV